MKTYTFKVWLPPQKDIFRKIEIRADHTLITLHRAIQDAFEFDDDHLFSFYTSGKAWDRSTEYSLPENLDMGPWDDTYDEFGQPRTSPRKKTKVEARRKAREQAQAEAEWKQVTGLAFPRTPEEIEAAIQTLAERQGFPPSLVRKMVADLFAKIETETGIRDVRQVQLQSLNLKPKQTIMYLFDYGDEWRFKVQLDKIIENAPDAEQYPRIVESRGEAPTQYPTEEEMEAAYQEHEAAYRESIRELLEEYSDPAKVASLFQQSKLTDDDKEYITVTLLDLIERHFIPKYGGKDPLDLYSVGMTPYGQHLTLTGYRNGISLPASKTYVNVYPELAKLKYLGSGKFEIFYKEGKSKWQSGAKDVPYSECLRLLETDERFVAALKR